MNALYHPTFGFELPRLICDLVAFLRRGDDATKKAALALGIEEFDPAIEALVRGAPPPSEDIPSEVVCPIFEVVPLAWTGVDGMHYGLLVYADELATSSALVLWAWSAGWDRAALVGEDVEQGLAAILADSARRSKKAGSRKAEAAQLEAIDTLRLALSLRSETTPRQGRLPLVAEGWQPPVPVGWRFLEKGLAAGVLAPEAAFDPDLDDHDVDPAEDVETVLEKAHDALQRSYPASALAIAGTQFFPEEEGIPALRVMKDAYLALNRSFLAKRVEEHLQHLESGA